MPQLNAWLPPIRGVECIKIRARRPFAGGPPPAAASSQPRAATIPRMRNQAERYLNAALPTLNLRQWRIKVSPDLPPDDSWADVEVSQNLWVATIRLSNEFFKEAPEHQRNILTHELLHVHNAAMERMVERLEGVLGSQAYDILNGLWDTETERVADALAPVIAPLLPLPAFKAKG